MAGMNAVALLARVNAAIIEHTKLIQDRRKQLTKADSHSSAEAIRREIETLTNRFDVLKGQQKALKRGIIPDELDDKSVK
jgi:predicted  nucleic acid-binding Zn-ribbon protein